jgi:hypothetical protein
VPVLFFLLPEEAVLLPVLRLPPLPVFFPPAAPVFFFVPAALTAVFAALRAIW